MTNPLRNQTLTALALVAMVTIPLAAQQPPPPVDRYVVGQAAPPVTQGQQVMSLTLEQAIQLALDKNLELKVARMNPQSVDYQLASARAAFNPSFNGSYSYRNAASANNSNLEGAANVTSVNQSFNGGMSQTLPFHGSSVQATFSNGRNASNSTQNLRNPSFSSGLQFSFSMPLLAGFKIDNARNQLRSLGITRQIADIQLLTTIENTKANVRTNYWNLRQAIEAIEIQKRALDLAQRLFQDNKTKVEIGTLAQIDTLTSETAVANAEQSLQAAENSWQTAELNLKRLLASGPEDALYNSTLNPVEQAAVSVQDVDIKSATQRALENRTDIVQAKKNLEVSRLSLEITQDQLKPNLSLSSGYSASGQGGPQYDKNGTLLVPGGYGQAFRSAATFELPTWNVGFNVTYPLGMASAKAAYARAVLAIDQSEAQLKASELNLSASVKNAGLNVNSTYKQYLVTQKAREVGERNADAAQVRFENGVITNYEVVVAQNNLTSQRLAELRALISYLNAVAEFDRVQRVGG